MKYANLISASIVASSRLGPLELLPKYVLSVLVPETLLHADWCTVVHASLSLSCHHMQH